MYTVYKATIIICAFTVTIVAASLSQEGFDRIVQNARDTEPARLQALGYNCPGCSKVHGAPGPVMGAAGAPLIIGYLLWRRRRRRLSLEKKRQ
jgi:hypothetical protein